MAPGDLILMQYILHLNLFYLLPSKKATYTLKHNKINLLRRKHKVFITNQK